MAEKKKVPIHTQQYFFALKKLRAAFVDLLPIILVIAFFL